MSENKNSLRPPQAASPSLIDLVGPGFKPINGNIALEKAYFDMQSNKVRILEANTGQKFLKIEELTQAEAAQVNAILATLVEIGIPSDLLRQRRDRIRVHWTDHHSTDSYGDVGGEFDSQTGIAIVTRHPDRSIQNHHLLHEVTHGLLNSGTLFEHNGTVISSGNGLYDAVFANGERPDQELLETLRQINEGIVDTFALTESDLDTPSYLSGAIGGGYSNNINIIKGLSETQPQLLHDVLQTAFVSGVQSTEQATFYANAYRSQPIQ